MSTFKGYPVNDGSYYQVLPNGNAPDNLGVGDLIVTSTGTFLIIAARQMNQQEKAQAHSQHGVSPITRSDYTVILYNKNLTTKNFKGTYLNPPQYTEQVQQRSQNNQLSNDAIISSPASHDDLTKFDMPDNYIYFYHLDQFIMLPLYADSVSDTMSVSFEQSTPLSRSAPIFSYRSSGPRVVQVGFDLHRDLMKDLNYQKSNVNLPTGSPGITDDYVDVLIRYIEAAALPVYQATNKMVNPPIVAMRLGPDIFIKGVVTGQVGKTYKFPILRNGKYAVVNLNFAVSEVEPYDAWDAVKYGSYRGIDTTLERRMRV